MRTWRVVRVAAAGAVMLARAAVPQAPPVTLTVSLSGAPATEYRTGEPVAPVDRGYATEVERRFPALEFSSNLARAARELGGSWAGGDLADEPGDLITFLLHSSGCPDATATAAVVSSTGDDDGFVWTKIAACLREEEMPFTHVGVARVADPTGAFRWRWVILLVQRRFALEPVPRAAAAGAKLRLAFSLGRNLRDPEVIVGAPGGATRRIAARPAGNGWEAVVALGEEAGEHSVELLAEDERGPQVLALFPVSVGVAPQRQWRGEPTANEAAIVTVADAERVMWDLVNRERTRNGRLPLAWDARLAAVARAHAEDMRDHGFLGHVSPTSGDVGDRLHRAGWAYTFAAENISRSSSLSEAMVSLMRSPGHRSNLLSTMATRGGVGVAIATDAHGQRAFVITQVFVKAASPPVQLR